MGTADDIAGILPTVIVAGIATKMTKDLFSNGSERLVRKSKRAKGRRSSPLSKKYNPW